MEIEPEIIKVIRKWMEGEINTFIKVWLTVLSSLTFCYFATTNLRHPKPAGRRLLPILPVVCLNLILPLNLITMHLGGSTAFFLAWLSNFKLLLFAFDKGPLSQNPPLSLPHFLAIACLPIKIKPDPPLISTQKGLQPARSYFFKCLIIPLLLRVYKYSDYLHPWIVMGIYSFHLYIGLEIILAIFGGLARALFGFELDPQFDEPYLSSSLQDFWGRRWNIMVTRILRPSVYDPVLSGSSKLIGRKWAPMPAIFCTFMVSGLMHELIFFYLGRTWPTWELSCFFLLHGVCLMIEVAVKKAVMGRVRIPRVIAAPLTVGFVMVTGFWLFFPEFLRCDSMERAFKEYAAMNAFAKDVGRALGL